MTGVLAFSLLASPTVSADPAEGFLAADPPLQLSGELSTNLADPSILVRASPDGPPQSLVVISAAQATIERVTLDTHSRQLADAPEPVGPLVVEEPRPSDGVSRETITLQNVTLELSAFGQDSVVLLAPSESQGLLVDIGASTDASYVSVHPEGLEVIDGYRTMYNLHEHDSPFNYTYTRQGPLIGLEESPVVTATGGAQGYVWGAHVVVRNESSILASYDTGAEIEESDGMRARSEHYEYLVLDLEGIETTLASEGLGTELVAPGMRMSLDGMARVPSAEGTITADDGVYRADDQGPVSMIGNVSLSLTPRGSPADRLSIGLDGTLSQVSIPLTPNGAGNALLTQEGLVAVGAGSTILGLAAWYAISAKGAGLAILARPSSREEDGEEVVVTPGAAGLERPSELLFDPDRFTLYHLIRSQPGLSAKQCADTTGIREAGSELDRLVDHGLLTLLDENPRRYALPGAIPEHLRSHVAFLRRPRAGHLAQLLAVRGLTPVARLEELARATQGPLRGADISRLVEAFVNRGLAYREDGELGVVVDPTERLFECLDRMERVRATSA